MPTRTLFAAFALSLAAAPLLAQQPEKPQPPQPATPQIEYRLDPTWPADGGKAAPGYGKAAVSAVAADKQGNVYLFQRAETPLLVFDRRGRYLRGWGKGLFTNPHGCRIDPQGNIWVTDNADHRVMKFSPEGNLLLTLGEKGVAGDDRRHFNKPTDVAFAPNGGFYVSDGYGNSRVVRFSPEGRFVGEWGTKGTGEGQFNLPHSVALDAKGRVYVADRENARIQVFDRRGKFVSQWADVGHPYGLFLTPDQKLFVSDGVAGTVSLYDLEDHRLGRWGRPGHEPGQMDLPHLITVDDQGAVYVAEVNGKRVQKFLPPAP